MSDYSAENSGIGEALHNLMKKFGGRRDKEHELLFHLLYERFIEKENSKFWPSRLAGQFILNVRAGRIRVDHKAGRTMATMHRANAMDSMAMSLGASRRMGTALT